MSEFYDCKCPACGAVNYIDNGDTTDLTVMDVSEFTCWKCKAEVCMTSGEFHENFDPHVKGTRPEDGFFSGAHVEGMKFIGSA